MSFIPGLLAGLIPDFIEGAEEVVKGVIGDAVHGKIHSGSDFGKSLLGGIGKAIGIEDKVEPASTQMAPKSAPTQPSDSMLQKSNAQMPVMPNGVSSNIIHPRLRRAVMPNHINQIIKPVRYYNTIQGGAPVTRGVYDQKGIDEMASRMAADEMKKMVLTDTTDHKIMEDRRRAKLKKYEKEHKQRKAKKKEKAIKAGTKKIRKEPVKVEGKLPKLKTVMHPTTKTPLKTEMVQEI